MATFYDLKFSNPLEPWNGIPLSIQAKMTFSNGYSVSVVLGPYTYGADDGEFELAIMVGNEMCYDTPLTEDVVGFLEPDDVTEWLQKIEALPARK